jgi:serine/threonine protein kinase
VHTDIKPQNVLVFGKKKSLTAKVNDFGCACFGAAETDFVELRGSTREWMAPEQGVPQEQFTILKAKKVDAFSFGKLCAWLLFSQASPHDIPEPGEEFDFELALNTLLNSREAHASELAEVLEKITPELRSFFASSYNADANSRLTLHLLSKKLASMVRTWEQRNGYVAFWP